MSMNVGKDRKIDAGKIRAVLTAEIEQTQSELSTAKTTMASTKKILQASEEAAREAAVRVAELERKLTRQMDTAEQLIEELEGGEAS